MADPLLSLYPHWIENCKKSIVWIQDGSADIFYKERGKESPYKNQSDRDRDIRYYERMIQKYERAMKGEY